MVEIRGEKNGISIFFVIVYTSSEISEPIVMSTFLRMAMEFFLLLDDGR